MREVRLPVDAVPTNSLRMLAHVPAIGGAVLRLIHAIPANADLDLGLRTRDFAGNPAGSGAIRLEKRRLSLTEFTEILESILQAAYLSISR